MPESARTFIRNVTLNTKWSATTWAHRLWACQGTKNRFRRPCNLSRKNLVSGKLQMIVARALPFQDIQQGCRRFCNAQDIEIQHGSIGFNASVVTDSISITCDPRKSTKFNNLWNLVRDQGVGGSNPLSPTIQFFPALSRCKRWFKILRIEQESSKIVC